MANVPPIAADDAFQTLEDKPFQIVFADLLANDVDTDGHPLRLFQLFNPVNGTLTVGGAFFSFEPAAEFSGLASFQYGITDDQGGTDVATVTIEVLAVDDPATPPVQIAYGANEDQAFSLVLAPFTDPDDALTHSLTLAGGAALPDWLSFDAATMTLSGQAPQDFFGPVALELAAVDGEGEGGTAPLTLTVANVNDAPVAVDDYRAIGAGGVLTVPLIGAEFTLNDIDADGNALRIFSYSSSTNGTLSVVGGSLLFTPLAGFTGIGQFSYFVTDDVGGVDKGEVFVLVGDLPITAGADSVDATEDVAATIAAATLLANDASPGGKPLTIESVGGAVNGTVSLVSGDVVFQGDADFDGQASFDYTVRDIWGRTETTTVTVTVAAANDAPEAGADALGAALAPVRDGVDALIDPAALLANDRDIDGDPVAFGGLGAGPALGSLAWVRGPGGRVLSYRYEGPALAEGATALDTFTYWAEDGRGGRTEATVTVTVTGLASATVPGGSRADDLLGADLAHDLVLGGGGDDRLRGLGGRDDLRGAGGADTLEGGDGADRLLGGAGADILIGGEGDDRLGGGAGADVFAFGSPGGAAARRQVDLIVDFEVGVDSLRLDDGLLVDRLEIRPPAGPLGDAVAVLVLQGGDRVVLWNVGAVSLDDLGL